MADLPSLRAPLYTIAESLEKILEDLEGCVLDSSSLQIETPEIKLAHLDNSLEILNNGYIPSDYVLNITGTLTRLKKTPLSNSVGAPAPNYVDQLTMSTITKISTVPSSSSLSSSTVIGDLSCSARSDHGLICYLPSMSDCNLNSMELAGSKREYLCDQYLGCLLPCQKVAYLLNYRLLRYLKVCWSSYRKNEGLLNGSKRLLEGTEGNGATPIVEAVKKAGIYRSGVGARSVNWITPSTLESCKSVTNMQSFKEDETRDLLGWELLPMFHSDVIPPMYLSPISGIGLFAKDVEEEMLRSFEENSKSSSIITTVHRNGLVLVAAARLLKAMIEELPNDIHLEVRSSTVLEIQDSNLTPSSSLKTVSYEMINKHVTETIKDYLGEDFDTSFKSLIINGVERNIVQLAWVCSTYQKRLEGTFSSHLTKYPLSYRSITYLSIPACTTTESIGNRLGSLTPGSTTRVSLRFNRLLRTYYLSKDNVFLDLIANNSFDVGLVLGNFHRYLIEEEFNVGSNGYALLNMSTDLREIAQSTETEPNGTLSNRQGVIEKILTSIPNTNNSRLSTSCDNIRRKYLLTTASRLGVRTTWPRGQGYLSNDSYNIVAINTLTKSIRKMMNSLATFTTTMTTGD